MKAEYRTISTLLWAVIVMIVVVIGLVAWNVLKYLRAFSC